MLSLARACSYIKCSDYYPKLIAFSETYQFCTSNDSHQRREERGSKLSKEHKLARDVYLVGCC
jgi:hypothetical protein